MASSSSYASSRSGFGWQSGGLSMSSAVLKSENTGIYGGYSYGGGGIAVASPPTVAGRRSQSKEETETEVKYRAALKSHCEAERRRRERINGHFDTLRGLVPCNGKMDKATLLAEVISHLKLLKTNATDASKGLLIPTDSDEVLVEPLHDPSPPYQIRQSSDYVNSVACIRVSVCCDYNPELMDCLRQAITSLKLCMLKTEISTLANRMKAVFVFSSKEESVNRECQISLVSAAYMAFRSVVDKITASDEYTPRRMRSTLESYGNANKRQKVSSFGFSVSSAGVD